LARGGRRIVVHVVIAVTVGVLLFRVVPHRVIEALVAGIFFLGALLALREAENARRGREAGNGS